MKRCLFGLLISFLLFCSGCATSHLQSKIENNEILNSLQTEGRNFWQGTFGESSGLDPRAREIERRLGY